MVLRIRSEVYGSRTCLAFVIHASRFLTDHNKPCNITQLDSQRETLERRARTAEELRNNTRRARDECLTNRTRVSDMIVVRATDFEMELSCSSDSTDYAARRHRCLPR